MGERLAVEHRVGVAVEEVADRRHHFVAHQREEVTNLHAPIAGGEFEVGLGHGPAVRTVVERDVPDAVVVAEGLEEAPELPGFDLGIETNERSDTPEGRLDHWKRKLLDLTKRNRLLSLKPSKTAIPLICPDPAALEDKLAEGTKISVRPLVKPTQEGDGGRDLQLFQQNRGEDYVREFAQHALENNELVSDREQKELDAGLVELYRKAKSDLQEGGANTLFLALGMLKWKQSENETRSYRAPLILVPVRP